MSLPRVGAALFLIPLGVFWVLFLFEPLLWVVVHSFLSEGSWSMDQYRKILASPFTVRSFANSLWVSLGSSLAGLAIAAPGAWAIRGTPGRVRDLLVSFCNTVSNFSGVPLAFAFIVLLGTQGSLTLLLRRLGIEGINLYSTGGLVVLYTYFQVPLGLLMLYPAFDALKEEWREAAALLGAGELRYWLRVGVPVLVPSLLGTFSLLFANALGAYATAYALTSGNSNLVPLRISALVAGDVFLDPSLASALAVLLLGMVGAVTLLSVRCLGSTTPKEVRR